MDEGGSEREAAVTPSEDLNIQWTTSTSGSSARRDTSTSGSSEEVTEGPPSGLKVGGSGNGAAVVDGSGEKVTTTPPIEPSAQPIAAEEGRENVEPPEDTVLVEGARSSKEERERVTSGEEWERGSVEDVVMTERM